MGLGGGGGRRGVKDDKKFRKAQGRVGLVGLWTETTRNKKKTPPLLAVTLQSSATIAGAPSAFS